MFLVRYGIGKHQYYVLLTPGLLIKIFKVTLIAEVLIVFSVMFIRLSIAVTLLRIFGPQRSWRLILYSVIVWIAITWVAAFAIAMAACTPVQKQWEPLAPGTCWDPHIRRITGVYIGGERNIPKPDI